MRGAVLSGCAEQCGSPKEDGHSAHKVSMSHSPWAGWAGEANAGGRVTGVSFPSLKSVH